jgi:hypothetical protein
MKVSRRIRNRRSKKLALIVSAVSFAALALQHNDSYAQERPSGIEPIAVLSPSDVPPGYTNFFGWTVAISGDWIAVGAPHDPVFNGDATGAVYIFRRIGPTWVEHAKLTASDAVGQEQLGWSVAIDGDVIVAGAPKWQFESCLGPTTGAVYVFRRDDHGTPDYPIDDAWPQEAKLTVADPRIAERLGMSVAVSGNVIVAGGECGGAAVVFRWDGTEWLPDGTLRGSDTQDTDSFGRFVSVAGNVVGVTSSGDAYPCPGFEECRGSAYVFRYAHGSWNEEAKLIGSGVRGIGSSISAFHQRIVVGRAGGPHVFRFGVQGWVEEQILFPSDPFAIDFGKTVAINADALLAGSPADSEVGNHTGAAFLFRHNQAVWVKISKLTVEGIPLSSALGTSVALTHDYGVVGAWHGAYVYRICDGCGTLREFANFQNCFGSSASAESNGTCRLFDFSSDNDVDLVDFDILLEMFTGP